MRLIFLFLWVLGINSGWAQHKSIILAITTRTQDSGLLDVLNPIFRKKLDIL